MEDGGVSGKTAKRRSVFQQMIAIAKSPQIDNFRAEHFPSYHAIPPEKD